MIVNTELVNSVHEESRFTSGYGGVHLAAESFEEIEQMDLRAAQVSSCNQIQNSHMDLSSCPEREPVRERSA